MTLRQRLIFLTAATLMFAACGADEGNGASDGTGAANTLPASTEVTNPATTEAPDVSPSTAIAPESLGAGTELVAEIRERGECPNGVCAQNLVWSDGHVVRIGDSGESAGDIDAALVDDAIELIESGTIDTTAPPVAGCSPATDGLPDLITMRTTGPLGDQTFAFCATADDIGDEWSAIVELRETVRTAAGEPTTTVMLHENEGTCPDRSPRYPTTVHASGYYWSIVDREADDGSLVVTLIGSRHTDAFMDEALEVIETTDFTAIRDRFDAESADDPGQAVTTTFPTVGEQIQIGCEQAALRGTDLGRILARLGRPTGDL